MGRIASRGWKSPLGSRVLQSGRRLRNRNYPLKNRRPKMKTILFADDNKNIREYCRASLEDEGYRVVVARDGFEAVQAYRTECPDLAILDLSMPRVGGMEAMERIKVLAPDLPVILFTANDDECLRHQRATLATACVEKSRNLGDLKQIVASTLRRSRSGSGETPSRQGLPPIRKEVGCS